MIFPAVFFYLFAGVCIAAAFMVIASKNPVHSVLFLILAFVNAAGLFILMGAEFLAMILVIVYVGAVLVLFLFVVMMLDVDFAELRQGFLQYLPIGAFLGIMVLTELVMVVGTCDHIADPAHRQDAQCRGARACAVHAVYLFLPGCRGRAAGGNDRRHRVDAAPQAQHQAPEHRGTGRAHQGDGDRYRQGAARSGSVGNAQGNDMTIGLGHYLTVAAILFTIGVFGIFLNRKNVIIILMSIELILLAVNINLVAFSTFLGDLVGQVFALLVLTVAAAEAAIGLAILVAYYRNRGSIAVEDINLMKG
jgi:NADH-quinone oxidoreductase subunit K